MAVLDIENMHLPTKDRMAVARNSRSRVIVTDVTLRALELACVG